ncbi:MAG: DUF599 domain-containing protein [Deltaproteobacteria bacterium]|nr:DUF599 domain-containing protein [Deltaproteobacteria bacterium]NCP96762.1 DUF599 domain-containing protein [Deltaproteobacteria bacterium]NCS73306.1 DUF599 domain-containing protein [Deltaproteobacteria bacterium]OIP65630.1 MAG: hypothetical protein AUK30_04210 [Nitrospirae bacterium CG2_30_70_394]
MATIALPTLPLRALLEWTALALFLACWRGYEWYHGRRTRRAPASTRLGRLQTRQREWTTSLLARDEPIVFIQALRNLARPAIFLGSVTILALGGTFGLLLSGERLRALCEVTRIFGHPSPLLAQLKLLALAIVLALAFLEFVWALRAVLAAHWFTAGNPAEATARVADLTSYLADFQLDFRHGLRTAYYAVCLLLWPFSVEAFIAATVVLTVMMARYDLRGAA